MIAERLGSFRIVVSDGNGFSTQLAYVSASSSDGRPTYRCGDGRAGERFACIESGIRTVVLEAGEADMPGTVNESSVVLVEESEQSAGRFVSLTFVDVPIRRGGNLPAPSTLRVLDMDCACGHGSEGEEAESAQTCASGNRARRLVGLRRSEGVCFTPIVD